MKDERSPPPLRVVDGWKVAFVASESYFASMATPSMYSTHKATGANVVVLLAEGVAAEDVSDEDVRALIAQSRGGV